MKKLVNFYFTYKDNEEYEYHIGVIKDVFGANAIDNLDIHTSEKYASIGLDTLNETQIFELLQEYDEDELRIVFIADTLIVGTNKVLSELGF